MSLIIIVRTSPLILNKIEFRCRIISSKKPNYFCSTICTRLVAINGNPAAKEIWIIHSSTGHIICNCISRTQESAFAFNNFQMNWQGEQFANPYEWALNLFIFYKCNSNKYDAVMELKLSFISIANKFYILTWYIIARLVCAFKWLQLTSCRVIPNQIHRTMASDRHHGEDFKAAMGYEG